MDTITTIQSLLMCNGSARPVTVELTPNTEALIAASPTLLEALEQLLKDVDDLMGSSEGVAGLHHNGELAPWSELAEGGQFSDWIGYATAKARAAITLATGKDA